MLYKLYANYKWKQMELFEIPSKNKNGITKNMQQKWMQEWKHT